ncbi:MAG: inositol monophosphatase family protein [Anaerolineales bacterium]|jgi:myo-inositol-1(or 4)-monophosphatase|nr:inositol monophosphatase family protein [Anaerolineales bacterium]
MSNPPVLADLERLARQAGSILSEGYEQDIQVDYKGEIDLVTEFDHRSEQYILAGIAQNFPGHSVMAEESGGINGSSQDLWIIDPLDGTVNYAHGVPIYSVAIAYAHNGQLTLGAVYDPSRDEMFLAEKGRGAWLNGRPLQVKQVADLSHALLVTGFPYDVRTTAHNNLENYANFALNSQGVRRLGSAALDLCYVGAGRFDGYWELSLKAWDLAAGALVALEAGARVTDIYGQENFFQPPLSVVAANPVLHKKILEQLSV